MEEGIKEENNPLLLSGIFYSNCKRVREEVLSGRVLCLQVSKQTKQNETSDKSKVHKEIVERTVGDSKYRREKIYIYASF